MKRVKRLAAGCIAAGWLAGGMVSAAGDSVTVNGYLEYRKGAWLIVDGQRVEAGAKTRFTGTGRARSLDRTPMGYEIRVKGERRSDGVIAAGSIEANPNRTGSLEKQMLESTDQVEAAYLQAGRVFDKGEDGKERVIGALRDKGPEVDRARRIVDRLLPRYVPRERVSVYVVDNKEWNAMAMPNYSIYVFSQLMADLDDDELAVVLGHEVAHATHEHSLRQAKRGMIGGLAGAAAGIGAQMIDNPLARQAAQAGAALGVVTFSNVYSRSHEDQADRAGLRYVYEAGFDHRKAPVLWRRFAEKYGDQGKVANFFFGDHSTSARRAQALEQEIRNNYDVKADPPGRSSK